MAKQPYRRVSPSNPVNSKLALVDAMELDFNSTVLNISLQPLMNSRLFQVLLVLLQISFGQLQSLCRWRSSSCLQPFSFLQSSSVHAQEPCPKKDDPTLISGYCPISIMSYAFLLKHLQPLSPISREHGGFRTVRSAIDQVDSLDKLIRESKCRVNYGAVALHSGTIRISSALCDRNRQRSINYKAKTLEAQEVLYIHTPLGWGTAFQPDDSARGNRSKNCILYADDIIRTSSAFDFCWNLFF